MAKKIQETTDAETELSELRDLRTASVKALTEWNNKKLETKEAKELYDSLQAQINGRLDNPPTLWDKAEENEE